MCSGDLTSASVLAAITRPPKKSIKKNNCNDVFFNKQCKLQCVHLSLSYNLTINYFMNIVV